MEQLKSPKIKHKIETRVSISAQVLASQIKDNPEWFGRLLYHLSIELSKKKGDKADNYAKAVNESFNTLSPRYMDKYPQYLVYWLHMWNKATPNQFKDRGMRIATKHEGAEWENR